MRFLRPGWTVGIGLATVAVLAILAWQSNLFDIRAGSVATAFDQPPPYPGYTWTRDGRAVAPEEMETIAGPSHCG